MPEIPIQPVVVRFGALDEKRAPKHSILTSLKEAINVRQRKLGRYDKRYGSTPLNRTADSGSITAGTGIASTPDALVMHADDTLWVRDSVAAQWLNRGTVPRAWPTDTAGIDQYGRRPTSAISGSTVYIFTQGVAEWYYRVIDLTTGIELKARTTIANAGNNAFHSRAITAGGFVWYFYTTAAAVITLAKFNPATPTVAPTTTTFITGGVATIGGFDVVSTVNGAAVIVRYDAAATPTGGVGNEMVWASFLTTATGLATALVPLAVTCTAAAGAVNWLSYAGANGFLYFVVSGTAGAANQLFLHRIVATTLATLTTTWTTTGAGIIGRLFSGYVNGSNIYVYVSDVSDGANPGTESTRTWEDATVTLHTWNGAVRTGATFKKGHWTASEPFLISSTWYIILGHDDYDDVQRNYVCVNALTGKIVGRAMYDHGGSAQQRAHAPGAASVSGFAQHSQVTVSGNKAYMALCQSDSATAFSTRFVTWDFAMTYGPLRSIMNERQVILPGAWPQRISAQDSAATEIVPMMFPSTPTGVGSATASTLAAGTYGFKFTYLQVDAAGNEYRSGESPLVEVTIGGPNTNIITLTVRTLRQTNEGTPASIETWMTAADGATYLLSGRTPNVTTANTVTIVVTAAPTTGAEELYAAGGVLSNQPPPPFRFLFQAKNRTWLSDTDREGETWYSKEYVIGRGPEFAPPLKVNTFSGRGRTRAGGLINTDYLALFSEKGWFGVSGAGPDDTGGGGSFQLLDRTASMGCTIPASVASFVNGLMFQAPDGLVYLIGADLVAAAVGAKVYDYASGTVTAAEHVENAGEVRFRLSTGKSLIYDYGNAGAQAPDGYWYVDESTAFGAAVASCVHAGVSTFVDSSGKVWQEVASQFFDDTSTAVLRTMQLQTLQLADLLGDLRINYGRYLGTFKSAHTLRVTTTVNDGTPSAFADKAITAAPIEYRFRKSGWGNVTSFDIKIQDIGTDTGEGSQFEGIVLGVQLRGKDGPVRSGQRL